jgi:nicotinate-nucleotide adenylyltransferase
MGEDNLKSLHKWKNYEAILKHHDIYVSTNLMKRKTEFKTTKKIKVIDAPL